MITNKLDEELLQEIDILLSADIAKDVGVITDFLHKIHFSLDERCLKVAIQNALDCH